MTAWESPCRVYWGSHGCDLGFGHEGYCRCECAVSRCEEDFCGEEVGGWCIAGECSANVGAYPYYGDDTRFYGEDAPTVWPDRVLNPEIR